jgi:hypothetical protein
MKGKTFAPKTQLEQHLKIQWSDKKSIQKRSYYCLYHRGTTHKQTILDSASTGQSLLVAIHVQAARAAVY